MLHSDGVVAKASPEMGSFFLVKKYTQRCVCLARIALDGTFDLLRLYFLFFQSVAGQFPFIPANHALI